MARNDELDSLLNNPKMTPEDWVLLGEIMGDEAKTVIAKAGNVKNMNEYVRHTAYGHTFANVFRTEYEPDYIEIVRAVATRLKIQHYPHNRVVDLEAKILAELLEAAKAAFIKEKGAAAWEQVEREAGEEFLKLALAGKLSTADIAALKGAAPGAILGLILAGRLSGFGVYMWANKIFFMISKKLGLGLGVAVAGPVIGRVLSIFLGPAGWILTGVWLAYDMGNTSWPKTIRAAVAVALVRRKLSPEHGA